MNRRNLCTILLCAISMMYAFGISPSIQSSGAAATTIHWYSPIFNLGPKARTFFTCVIYRESRSTWDHPVTHDGDAAYPGQFGIFQFVWPSSNNTWDAYVFPVLHVEPRFASARQQAEAAAILWKLGPGEVKNTWSRSDGCQP